MAKSKSFFGLRKGSTKTLTLSVLNGQQITKDRVTDVANPKTQGQMVQRMLFANAVKFYKHGVAAFFKFAFEDKKPLESDYNAFMRHNAKSAVAVSRENYNDAAYPAFGRYQLTQGSLVPAVLNWPTEPTVVNMVTGSANATDTIGALSQAILNGNASLLPGDIVTIVLIHTSLKNDGTMSDERINRWDIRQFILDVNDNRDSIEVLGISYTEGEEEATITNVGGEAFDKTHAKGAAVIFSRNTPSGLKVSTSEVLGNPIAQQFIDEYGEAAMVEAMANTWGATEKAILQGSLAE